MIIYYYCFTVGKKLNFLLLDEIFTSTNMERQRETKELILF